MKLKPSLLLLIPCVISAKNLAYANNQTSIAAKASLVNNTSPIINNVTGTTTINNPSQVVAGSNTTPTNGVGSINLGNFNLAPVLKDVLNVYFENYLGFENAKWTAIGPAFANQPIRGDSMQSERVLARSMNGIIGGDYWKGMKYPIGYKGNQWIGTAENGNGDVPTGTLTSMSFSARKRYLTFLLGGGRDLTKLFVELQVKKADYEAAWGAGKSGLWGDTTDGYTRVERITPALNSEELFRYYFDLDGLLKGQFQGKILRLRIVDAKSSLNGHINVDDFVFKDQLNDYLNIQRSGISLLADRDKSVWGFADTHAHWVNHVGLNGLMHGTPGGKLETSNVLTDIPPCDGFNHQLPSITPALLIAQVEKAAFNRAPERVADFGNFSCAALALPTAIAAAPVSLAALAFGALDAGIGNALIASMFNPAFQACGFQFTKDVLAKHYSNNIPNATIGNFVDYPRWNSFFHQTMHISWVRRSYDGGQRLMVVPVGVAKSWEFNTTSNGVMGNPVQHIEAAVAYLKQLVALNPEWLGIATTPAEARQIILSNKMAIVIALEQAEIGSYFADINQEINWLYNLGIRHVFPIHNINNKLGGAAVFNSNLISYNDLVNRSSQDGPIESFAVRSGYTNADLSAKTETLFSFKDSFMRQGMRTIPIAGFGTMPFFYLNDIPQQNRRQPNGESYISVKNADGLSSRGQTYMTELMKKAMIIDIDHMSDLSQDEAMRILQSVGYPMISGHTNFRELRAPLNNHNTDDEAKMKTEFTIHSTRADEINNAGGMFGLMTQQSDIETVNGCPVKNNAPGGTPTFSQAYCYVLQKTNGEKGIAFGTDFNGFAPQTAPRFGVDAAATIEGDKYRNQVPFGAPLTARNEDNNRRIFAFIQTKGVRYATPINTYHYHRFLKPSFLTSEEREIWEALAMAKTGVDINRAWQPGGFASVERTGLQQNKISNLAIGFKLNSAQYEQLDCPDYGIAKGDCPAERKATYMAVNGEAAVQSNWKDARTMELFKVVQRIYELWLQFENGPNEPLQRSYAYPGGRDFDYNLDGLAHYGMFPDLIQDMKNLGFTPNQLRPLFMASEEYIKMWEKAELAKNNIR